MLKRANHLLQNNATPMPQVQVELTTDDVLDGVDHYQPYGLASTPPPGAEAIVAYVNGNRSDAICLMATDATTGKPFTQLVGEVALYHPATGSYIQLKNTGQILSKGNWVHEGNLTTTGQLADGVGTLAQVRTTYNGHTHGSSPLPTPLMGA